MSRLKGDLEKWIICGNMSSRQRLFLRLCPPFPVCLCVPYNLEFPPVNSLPPAFSLLIYFHSVAFGRPTVSKMLKSMPFSSLGRVEDEPVGETLGRATLGWAVLGWTRPG